MGEKKAIVAGHICIDIIPVFSGKEEKEIEDLFRPGAACGYGSGKDKRWGRLYQIPESE